MMLILEYLPALWHGIQITTALTAVSVLAGSILGIVVGTVAVIRSHLRILARAHIEFFLGMPPLVLLVWLFYALPLINTHLTFSPFWTAVLAFSLSLSGFVGEIIESGYKAIPKGQLDAALMLNIHRLKALRYIVLPQVLSVMWPSLMTQFITTYKFSTLASVVAVNEVLHVGGQIIQDTYQPLVVYTAIAIFFVVTVYPLNILARKLHERIRTRGGLVNI